MIEKNLDHEEEITALIYAFNTEDESNISSIINTLDDVILVQFLEVASSEHREKFIKNYINELILIDISQEIKREIFDIVGVEKYTQMTVKLDVEDALVVIQELDKEKQSEILQLLPNDEKKRILHELLSYPEESAGRLINKDFIIIPEHWSTTQAINFLGMRRNIPSNQNQIFVVDKDLKPVGTIELSDILFSKKDTLIRQKVNEEIHVVTTDLDQEAVASIFQQYNLLSTAVVNECGQIVGLISADHIVEVVQKEAEEDIMHMGGVSSTDISTKFIRTILNRLPWLFITFLAINVTSVVVGFFEETIIKSVEIAILMPIIAAMGGNAGVQASTIAVRAIATKRLMNMNTFRLIVKELFVGFTNGVILSVCTIVIIAMRFHSFRTELIFSLSMIIVFSVATLVGSAIPILLNRIGFDPALSSSIVTSAITDLLGFCTLLGIASFFF